MGSLAGTSKRVKQTWDDTIYQCNEKKLLKNKSVLIGDQKTHCVLMGPNPQISQDRNFDNSISSELWGRYSAQKVIS
jgi:hypothetical protein